MKLPWRRNEVSRGQAMVEFAIVLPVIALLLVMAIDFGRVFFGWVALQNAARIGANNVALNPDGWTGTGDLDIQAEYKRQVLRDLEAINCRPPSGGAWTASDIPSPTFTDAAGNPVTGDPVLGDHAVVSLPCRFSLITPLAGNLLGDPLALQASAAFAVRGGIIQGVPVGPAPPPPDTSCTQAIVPNLVGKSVVDARALWRSRFSGSFDPDTGSDDDIVSLQTTMPSNVPPGTCVPVTYGVIVQHAPQQVCPSGEVRVPGLDGLTIAAARTAWTQAGFTGSFLPNSGFDAEIVNSQQTSTGKNPGQCSILSTLVTVGHASPSSICTAPDLFGLRFNTARQNFQAALFTGQVTRTGASTGTAQVAGQSLVAGQPYVCSSGILLTME